MMPLLSQTEWKERSKCLSCNNLHASCRLQYMVRATLVYLPSKTRES